MKMVSVLGVREDASSHQKLNLAKRRYGQADIANEEAPSQTP